MLFCNTARNARPTDRPRECCLRASRRLRVAVGHQRRDGKSLCLWPHCRHRHGEGRGPAATVNSQSPSKNDIVGQRHKNVDIAADYLSTSTLSLRKAAERSRDTKIPSGLSPFGLQGLSERADTSSSSGVTVRRPYRLVGTKTLHGVAALGCGINRSPLRFWSRLLISTAAATAIPFRF